MRACVPNPQMLYALELCSGAGGLSGLATDAIPGHHAGITTRWAVDIALSACVSFKVNHPETHVRSRGPPWGTWGSTAQQHSTAQRSAPCAPCSAHRPPWDPPAAAPLPPV